MIWYNPPSNFVWAIRTIMLLTPSDTGYVPELRRELKARHLTMIAIGGSIGTGLFVASGATISQAGPGGALLCYILIGLMVYFLMTSLGELAAYMPVSGSFSTYGSRYVEEGFGFALGWNYWYNWAVTIAVDLVASQLVMGYWFPSVPFRHLRLERHFGERVWRSGILVLIDQSRDGHYLYRLGRTDDCRNFARRRTCRLC
jgi:amino acid transporter